MTDLAPAELLSAFRARFPDSPEPALYRAPGRVNLIGEHTDYNAGFALPIAIELACYAAVAPATGDELTVHSADLGESRSWPVASIGGLSPSRDWSDYVTGVARELAAAGYGLAPANLLVRSTVPIGAGLSSSAALEVASALALLGARLIDRAALARLCHRAENTFAGMPCGLMDQTISVFGEPRAALCIDCRDLTTTAVPLPKGALFLAVDTMVKRELAGSAYRRRVAECGEAVAAIRRKHPEVAALRDARIEWLELVEGSPRKRAQHVVSENRRVRDFAAAARAGDLPSMGRAMNASHRSLAGDYEVSCRELDFLVGVANSVEGVFGARMTGGGFGGCTVNLMRPEAAPVFRETIRRSYKEAYGIEPGIYPCLPSPGAGPLT